MSLAVNFVVRFFFVFFFFGCFFFDFSFPLLACSPSSVQLRVRAVIRHGKTPTMEAFYVFVSLGSSENDFSLDISGCCFDT
jgi:hypothetical protein